MGLTLSTTYNGTLSLAPSDNPLTVTATGGVAATAAGADAIDGGSGVDWSITNSGTVSSTLGYGVNLAGLGDVSNSNSISGTGGVLLNDAGTVTNSSGGTITATGMMPAPLATISAIYVTGPSGGGMSAISVNNAGVVTAADGYGIGLGASGSVNNSGQVTGGEDGVVVVAGVGNIQNSGSITATLDDGVGLFQGGTVTNAVGASISGVVGVDAAGIFTTGGTATITNNGQINGSHYGILVAGGGSVTNSSSGTIQGQSSGVSLSHGGTLSNSGAISSTAINSAATDLELGGNLNNFAGGSIVGATYGAFITGAQGTVTNAGTLSGVSLYGIALNDGGSIHNAATGSITGPSAGVSLAGQSATVLNDGSISATGSGGAAIMISAGGAVTNDSGATLSAAAYGVFASGVAASVTNAGMVTSAQAIGFEAGGTVTNLSGGTLSGQTAGVFDAGGAGIVNNTGSITASASGGAAIDLEQSGGVTNNAGGTITGTAYGIFSLGGSGVVSNAVGASISSASTAVVMSGGANTLTNAGAITSTGATGVDMGGGGNVVTNGSGANIAGGTFGIFLGGGPGTVTNLGSISGGSYAVDFAVNSSANLLQVGGGATFAGSVNGDSGTLELLSGTGAIGGIRNGGQFNGFQSLVVDSGASWSFTGTGNTIANLTVNGALTLGGSLDVTGAVSVGSAGAFDLNASAVLELAAATGSQTAVSFLGASELVVDNAALFGTGVGGTSYQGSQLEDFGAGDSVDIRNFLALGATLAYDSTSGLLQISNGSQQATLDFQQSTLGGGSFQIGADASGSGVLITLSSSQSVVVTVANFEANQAQLDTLAGGFSISDTAANVAAALDTVNGDGHVTSIALTDPGTPALTLTVARALGDTAALSKITTPYTITISDTAANVAASLDALNGDSHVTSIGLTDPGTPTLTLTVARALGDTTALGEITMPHQLALADTATVIASLTSTQASALHAAGYATIASTTGAVSMTVAEAQLLLANGIAVTGGPLTATGSATAMLALTPAQGASLAGADYTLEVLDTAANIQVLTTAQVSSFSADHVTQIVATDTSVALAVVLSVALEGASIQVSAPTGSHVTVSDTGAHLQTLTVTQIGGLAAIGVSGVASTRGGMALSVAQTLALEGVALKVTPPSGSKVLISDLAANIAAMSASQMAALSATGVSGITATDTGVTLSLAQGLALESPAIKISVPTGSAFTISDTASDIQALTATQIAGLKTIGATALTATDANVVLTIAQAAALETAGVKLTPPSGGHDSIVDAAANIQTLTATQIAGLANLHVTQIAASDASVSLTVAQAKALETAAIPVATPSLSHVSISDTAANLQTLTAAQITGLPAIGVSGLTSNNGSVVLTAAKALALEGVALKVTPPSGSKVLISDLAANIAAMSASQMAALSATGVSGITATDTGVTLSLAQGLALESPAIKISVPTGSAFTISDTASDIQALTATQIAGLKTIGATALTATDANVVLTIAQAAALETAGVKLTPPSGGHDSIVDAAANIQTLTATQIAGLANLHVTQIAASDASVSLTVAQAKALETAAIPVATPSLSHVSISDTAANLQTLTAAQITGLPAIGVSGLTSNNAAVKFNVAQTIALEGGNLTVRPFAGTTVTVSDTGANIATLTVGQIGLLTATGFTGLTSTSGGMALSVLQIMVLEGAALKVTPPSGSKVTVSDAAVNIAAMSASQFAALSATGVSGITATGAGVTLSVAQALALASPAIKISVPTGAVVSISGTASDIQAFTAMQIAGLKSIGVTAVSASDANVTLTVAQAAALESAGVGLSPPTGGQDSIVGTAAQIQTLTAPQIAGLANLHVTQIAASDTNVALTTAQATALETAGVPVAANGSHVTVLDTAAHLQALTAAQISELPAIGVSGLNSSNANVTFSAFQTSAILAANLSLSASGTHTVAETFTNNAVIASASNGSGGGSLTLSTNATGLTVNEGLSAMSVTAGSETIPLNPYATESITATGRTNDTFAFTHGFGHDTIIGFASMGAGHDLIQFETAMFSYMTPAMSQAQDLVALLNPANGSITTSGGNTTITDSLGDNATLNSVSVATLAANPADFKFV